MSPELRAYVAAAVKERMRPFYEAYAIYEANKPVSTLTRIKTTEVAKVRHELYLAQAGRCKVCKDHIVKGEDVLDHCHTTGAVRAVLHRSCNALLGKVENNYKRHGVKNLAAWAHGVPDYLQHHAVNRTGLLHPTHRTPDEKRLRRNAAARKRRATSKV